MPCLSLMDCRSSSTGVNLGPKGATRHVRKENGTRQRQKQPLNFANIKWSRDDEIQEGEALRRQGIKSLVASVHHGLGGLPLGDREEGASCSQKDPLFPILHRRRILDRCCRKKRTFGLRENERSGTPENGSIERRRKGRPLAFDDVLSRAKALFPILLR